MSEIEAFAVITILYSCNLLISVVICTLLYHLFDATRTVVMTKPEDMAGFLVLLAAAIVFVFYIFYFMEIWFFDISSVIYMIPERS